MENTVYKAEFKAFINIGHSKSLLFTAGGYKFYLKSLHINSIQLECLCGGITPTKYDEFNLSINLKSQLKTKPEYPEYIVEQTGTFTNKIDHIPIVFMNESITPALCEKYGIVNDNNTIFVSFELTLKDV